MAVDQTIFFPAFANISIFKNIYMFIYLFIYMASLNQNSSLIFPLSLRVTPFPISTIIPYYVAVSCVSCSCYGTMHKLQCAFPISFRIYGDVAWRSPTDFRFSWWTVGTVTTLRNGLSEARIPAGGKDFYFLQMVQDGSGANPASCLTGTGALCRL